MLDIFNSDAFSLTSLTDRINTFPFVPGKIGALGIFDEEGINTTSVALEQINGTITLVPNQRRGEPARQNTTEKRSMRQLVVPHLPVEDTVTADEVQGVRAFGSEDQLDGVQSLVDRKMRRMTRSLDATVEYGRIGAVKGIIYDSDGSTVIYNLFTEFGVVQSTVDMKLGTAATDMLSKALDIQNTMEDNLESEDFPLIRVECGKAFFQRFITHANVKDAYKYYQATGQNVQPLREDLRYKGFVHGAILWEQYRGTVNSVAFVAATEAHAYPVGVPGLFKTYFAPADFIETANTEGLPRYAKQWPTDGSNRAITLHTQTNPLSICVKPKALMKLTTSD